MNSIKNINISQFTYARWSSVLFKSQFCLVAVCLHVVLMFSRLLAQSSV